VLVLTRKPGESIRIGENVIIKVLETGGGQVKIGISAPKEMTIHREEIYERIKSANVAAAENSMTINMISALPDEIRALRRGNGDK